MECGLLSIGLFRFKEDTGNFIIFISILFIIKRH
jgi:hypothetical protein